MDATERLLKELSEVPGISGNESAVRALLRDKLAGLAADVQQDGLGSLIARLPGTSDRPRIMLAGHMDEVGFMVRYITDGGFLRFLPIGGWWNQVMLAQQVDVYTSKGPVPGVIGAKPPHLLKDEERNKVVEKEAMYIDVGATSRDQVEALGIRVGDPVVPATQFKELAGGKTYLGKAWDNRIGCALIVEAFRALKGQPHPNTLFGVGTVQEEVGLRGARTSAHCVDPDIGLTLEVGIAGDLPDMKPEECAGRLGGGVELLVYDGSMVPNVKLRDLVIDTAREENIPLQLDVMLRGGTDAGAIHVNACGVPSIVLGVPTRHIHSHQGIINRDDFDAAVKLIVALIKKLDATTVAHIKE